MIEFLKRNIKRIPMNKQQLVKPESKTDVAAIITNTTTTSSPLRRSSLALSWLCVKIMSWIMNWWLLPWARKVMGSSFVDRQKLMIWVVFSAIATIIRFPVQATVSGEYWVKSTVDAAFFFSHNLIHFVLFVYWWFIFIYLFAYSPWLLDCG